MTAESKPRLAETLARHGQDHLLRWWDELDALGRARLLDEIERIDFDQIDDLVRRLVHGNEPSAPDPARVRPVWVNRLPHTDADRVARRHAAEIGEAVLSAGEVGVVLVAGGQGTRLGFDGPKGTYPIGPVSSATLFQIHAEKIVALGRRHGRAIPLYVMTSPDNHEATARFFTEHENFGLEHVRLFVQGQMPAVDRETGQDPAGVERFTCPEPRRTRRHLARAGRSRRERESELPRRDARAWHTHLVLLPGG